MLKNISAIFLLAVMIGCASTNPNAKVLVLEDKEVSQKHTVLGPVSITQEVEETNVDMAQGLAQYFSRNGLLSGALPPEMKAALDAKIAKYKETAFEALSKKAKESHADAVIAAEYTYTPPFVNLTKKATITAKGTMIKY